MRLVSQHNPTSFIICILGVTLVKTVFDSRKKVSSKEGGCFIFSSSPCSAKRFAKHGKAGLGAHCSASHKRISTALCRCSLSCVLAAAHCLTSCPEKIRSPGRVARGTERGARYSVAFCCEGVFKLHVHGGI